MLYIALCIMLLVSCTPFSRGMLNQVDESRPFSVIRKNPEQYLNRTVLWGGVIVQTTNYPNETEIQVRETALDFEKRPKDLDQSAGRFLVVTPGFLDPNIYASGREITVIGKMAGKKELPLGEARYSYPVLQAREIHLWQRRSQGRYYDPYWDDPFWGWRRYPYWWYRPPFW